MHRRFIVLIAVAAAFMGCPSEPPGDYTASGRIETLAGNGIPGVAVTVEDEGIIAFTRTDGSWSAGPLHGALTVVPLHRDWVFEPAHRTVAPGSPTVTGLDFTGRYRPVHPDTQEAPVLRFEWPRTPPYGALQTDDAPDGDILTCRPFGHEANGSAATSMTLVLRNRQREPILAPCAGTITHVQPWDEFETAAVSGGEVWIRYGVGHAVGFEHVVTEGAGLALGAVVARGDVIGYTADYGEGGSLFSISAGRRTTDGPEFVNPHRWYDSFSQLVLLTVWNGAADTGDPAYAGAEAPWGATDHLEDTAGELAEKALL